MAILWQQCNIAPRGIVTVDDRSIRIKCCVTLREESEVVSMQMDGMRSELRSIVTRSGDQQLEPFVVGRDTGVD